MTLNEWIENLQKKGRLTFTKAEALKAIGIADSSFRIGISRLSKKKKVTKISNGIYAAVPLHYQTGRGIPPVMYIDQLMKFYEQQYYIGLLSAATYFGATHQAVQELQVLTSNPHRSLKIDGAKVRFFTKKNLLKTPTQKMNVQSGQITISTPESTAIDLIIYMGKCGGINHIATVLAEMKDSLDSDKLLSICKSISDLSVIQRLGFILSKVKNKKCSEKIYTFLKRKKLPLTKLDPKAPFKNKINERWQIYENVPVEPDEI